MIIGNRNFTGGTHVMAIINLTPDSFYSPSRHLHDSLAAAERAVEEGAEILDLGPQSTRPGYTEVPASEEISRLVGPPGQTPRRFDVPSSVDTYFSDTARAALGEGADMINDVWGLSRDNGMAETIAAHNASVCIMHNAPSPLSGDIWGAIEGFLQNSVALALNAGIAADRICLDGGIGFAKSREQNLDLLQNYGRLNGLGYPLLMGASMKSLFGGDVNGRLRQTLEATALAVRMGVMFVRVHDVKKNLSVIKGIAEGKNG